MTNTKINYEGTSYTLIKDAFLTNHQFRAVYEAPAIKEEDAIDEDGWQKAYIVRWEILDDYNSECGDESLACDWDDPDEIIESGEYNASTGRFF